jgi:hypothetical protein
MDVSLHHIVQLQSIVDSFCVARGCSVSPVLGDVSKQPPSELHPRQDLDLFLKSIGNGELLASCAPSMM